MSSSHILRRIFTLVFFLILFTSVLIQNVLPQFVTIDNQRAVWSDTIAWKNNLYPGITINKGDIDCFGFISSYNCLDLNSGQLTIHDTLVIFSNLSLDNTEVLRIDSGAVLVILGDYLSRNKVEVYNNGTIIVAGEFEMLGSDNQGLFSNEKGGIIYLFDESPTIKAGASFSDLDCPNPDNFPEACGYGNRNNLEASNIADFFNTLNYNPEYTYGCSFFEFEGDVKSLCQNDTVSFSFIGNPSADVSMYTWYFGEDAEPNMVKGFGPFEVNYSSEGEKTILLTDGIDTIMKEKYINVLQVPSITMNDESICGVGVVAAIAKNVTGDIVYFSVDSGVSVFDTSDSSPYYTELILRSGNQIIVSALCIDTKTGCASGWVESGVFTSFEKPQVKIVGESILCENISETYYLDETYSSYLWHDESTMPEYTSHLSGVISVTVVDENNCSGSDSLLISYCPEETIVVAGDKFTGKDVQAFSPNGDNCNDFWVIDSIELYPLAKIFVYDQYGKKVFYSKGGYENDWDGTSNDILLPKDSYHFFIDLSKYNQESLVGIVTILY